MRWSRWIGVWLLPVAVSGVGCGGPAGSVRLPQLRVALDPVIATPIGLSAPISPENDAFGFALALDLRVVGDWLAVLENGNSRLVLFDSTFRASRTIGREGAGPGELRGAYALDAAGALYAVSEINNARISIFDTSGVFHRSVVVPGEAAFAFGSGGTLYVVAGSVDHYLLRIDSAGFRRPFGDRPLHLYPQAVQRDRIPPGVGRELVTTGPSGQVYVFDRVLAGIVRFDSDGRQTGIVQLPDDYREALLEHQRIIHADFGDTRRVFEVAIGDMTRTDNGELLLLFAMVDGAFGLLVDPGENRARRLEWSPRSAEAVVGAPGGFGVVHGGRLYRGSGDQVTVFRLDPAP